MPRSEKPPPCGARVPISAIIASPRNQSWRRRRPFWSILAAANHLAQPRETFSGEQADTLFAFRKCHKTRAAHQDQVPDAYRVVTSGRRARAKSSSVERCSSSPIISSTQDTESSNAVSWLRQFEPVVLDHHLDREPVRLIRQDGLGASDIARYARGSVPRNRSHL